MCEDRTCPSGTVVIMVAAYSNQIIPEICLQRNIEVRSDFSLPHLQIAPMWRDHAVFNLQLFLLPLPYFLHLPRQR